jgi:hypothetical protein
MSTVIVSHVGRNDPCPCGSGRKYKQCCLDKDQATEREALAKASHDAPSPTEDATAAPAPPARPRTHQPWKKSALNSHGFQRMSTPRKVGGG